jgi:hypothetical protein
LSRLDSHIRRLEAQRACLDAAVAAIAGVPGPAIELGLGNGRTYDHLRERLRDRPLYVFDRRIAAHPDCVPPDEFLVLGDFRQTIPAAARRWGAAVAFVHADIGSGVDDATQALAAFLGPALRPMLRPGAVIASDQPLDIGGAVPMELPTGVAPGRYFMWRIGP